MPYDAGKESLHSFLQIGELVCRRNGSHLSAVILDPPNWLMATSNNSVAQGSSAGAEKHCAVLKALRVVSGVSLWSGGQ